jgi:hypothetical protein
LAEQAFSAVNRHAQKESLKNIRKFYMYRTGRLYLLKNSAIIIRNFIIEEEALALADEEFPDEDDDTLELLYRPDYCGRREC